MAETRFDKVWYLPEKNRWRDMNLLAMRDAGTLVVNGDCLDFKGKKEAVHITEVKAIAFGKQGRDFVNNWVQIEYQDGKTAFFADGTWLGWGGIFGGTRKILDAIRHLQQPTAKRASPAAGAFQAQPVAIQRRAQMNSITIHCPQCQQAVSCAETSCGHHVRCPACQVVISVPAAPRLAADDSIHFSCPACGKHLRAKAESAGHRVRCSCGVTPTVPAPREPATATWENAHRPSGGSEPPPTSTCSVKPISKAFYFTSVAAGLGIAELLLVLAACSRDADVDAEALTRMAWIPMLFGAIVNLVLWHRMWAAIQDGHARTTPGKAIGFLFIPLFNIYWGFQVVWGFAKDYNAFIRRHGVPANQLPEGMFLVVCVLSLTGGIPVVGLILVLLNYCTWLVLVWKICDAVNAVALAPRQPPTLNAQIALAAGGQRQTPPQKKPDELVSYGTAGLILVVLRVFAVTSHLARDFGDLFWFIGSIGVMASLVGLVVCIIGLFKASGRGAAVVGIVLWCVFGFLSVAHIW
jgi:hypothetical protein